VLKPLQRLARRHFLELVDRVRRHRVLGEIYEAVDGTFGDFARDHGPVYAGAVAFYALLSLIPLLVLVASAVGYALHAQGNQTAVDGAVQDVVAQLKRVIPYIDKRFADDLRRIMSNRTGLGLVGLVALTLASSQVFRAVEFAFARIFARLDYQEPDARAAMPRNVVASKLWFSAFTTALVVAVVGYRLLAGAVRHVASGLQGPFAKMLEDPFADGTAGGRVVEAFLVVAGFVVLVKVFTHRKVHLRYAILGGGLFYASFQAAHAVYDVYLGEFTNMPALYGSFATLMIIVLWIYFAATLLIFSGNVVKYAQRRALVGPRWPKDGGVAAVTPAASEAPSPTLPSSS
jgi:membrane protein